MKYDPVKLPVGSRERAIVQFKKGDLMSALKTCKNGQIALQSVNSELRSCLKKLQDRKQSGTILSAYYKYGSDIDNDANSENTFIKNLLRQMFLTNDMSGFLKQAYRFGIYIGLEEEIEHAVSWHELRNLPDASAWNIKFQKLAEQVTLKTLTDKPIKLLQEESEESVDKKQNIYLTLKPVSTRSLTDKSFSEDENDPYIVSRTARTKMDRANQLHSTTLLVLKDTLKKADVRVEETRLIDAYASVHGKLVIFEVKSINQNNERDQVRHAVSQLFEYRYLYQRKEALLCVVLSGQPHSQWLVNYLLDEHTMLVTWVENGFLAGPSINELLNKAT